MANNPKVVFKINAEPKSETFAEPVDIRRGKQVPENIQLPPLDSLEARLDRPKLPFVTEVEESNGQIEVHTRQRSFRIEDLEFLEKVVNEWVDQRTEYGTDPAEIVY